MSGSFVLCYRNPNNVSYDYSYNKFQEKKFTDPNVLLTGTSITIEGSANVGYYERQKKFVIDLIFTFNVAQPDKPLTFDNLTSLKLSQSVVEDNKTYVENQHYLNWENAMNKRIEEVGNLRKDRDLILDKLERCDDDEPKNLESVSKQDLLKEIELLSQQINNHNKEIKNIETTSSNVEYIKQIQTNYIDLDKYYIGRMNLIDSSTVPSPLDSKNKKKEEYFCYEFYWYVDNAPAGGKVDTNPNKISIAQEKFTVIFPKLSPLHKTKKQKLNDGKGK